MRYIQLRLINAELNIRMHVSTPPLNTIGTARLEREGNNLRRGWIGCRTAKFSRTIGQNT
ncbi:hypothetical protein BDV29DRAFT_166743 [Aspergillus leporis]|jgi:hypothetical protein|uniref:Uncharacterized protein n=1 Tax=Aspergillus leporis TaxID=41062 RepID=A0A5N5XGQ4_9EURO|nr:hypothetical protein BDV29DRAFT_166743 [Aspergillus leporis]